MTSLLFPQLALNGLCAKLWPLKIGESFSSHFQSSGPVAQSCNSQKYASTCKQAKTCRFSHSISPVNAVQQFVQPSLSTVGSTSDYNGGWLRLLQSCESDLCQLKILLFSKSQSSLSRTVRLATREFGLPFIQDLLALRFVRLTRFTILYSASPRNFRSPFYHACIFALFLSLANVCIGRGSS